jgi:hypothetical protein
MMRKKGTDPVERGERYFSKKEKGASCISVCLMMRYA